MVKRKDLIKQMRNDMDVNPYQDEEVRLFQARLIYSAMSSWIRCSILDKTNENDHELKSKIYIRNRGEEVLDSFLKVFPNAKEYFYFENSPSGYHPISELRERMIKSQELVETFNGVGLNHGEIRSIDADFFRILGIEDKIGVKNVGLTRIVKATTTIERTQLIDPEEMFKSIIKNIKWEIIKDVTKFEIYNPIIAKPPYQCWDNIERIENEDVYLGRIEVTDYRYDYYWIKRSNNNYYISEVNQYLVEFKETRRFISYKRKMFNNALQLIAEMKDKVVIIKIYSRVPLREEIILDTYGWPLRNMNDKFAYVIPLELWDSIKQLFVSMNYQIKEK